MLRKSNWLYLEFKRFFWRVGDWRAIISLLVKFVFLPVFLWCIFYCPKTKFKYLLFLNWNSDKKYGLLFENRPALYFCNNYKENYKLIHVCWIPQINDFITIMEQYIFNIRIIIIIIIGNKKKISIFDTESKIIHFMVSNKFIIAKIKCWPVFKQDPKYEIRPIQHLGCYLIDALWF